MAVFILTCTAYIAGWEEHFVNLSIKQQQQKSPEIYTGKLANCLKCANFDADLQIFFFAIFVWYAAKLLIFFLIDLLFFKAIL